MGYFEIVVKLPDLANEYRIEFAERRHLSEILDLSAYTFAEHAARHPDRFAQDVVPGVGESVPKRFRLLYETAFPKRGNEKSDRLLVCLKDEKVVGHLFWRDDPWFVWVEDITVDAQHRGQHIGTHLLQELQRHIGGRHIQAQVWGGNERSQALFEAAGFSEIHRVYGAGKSDPFDLSNRIFESGKGTNRFILAVVAILFVLFAIVAFVTR